MSGAVRYQRERAWCAGCGAVVAHLRAVRVADGWHADWTCSALATTGGHALRADAADLTRAVAFDLTRAVALADAALAAVERSSNDYLDALELERERGRR